MYDELFEVPTVIARYRAGPYAVSREQFLKKAQTDGYSPLTLVRMARALLLVAEIVRDAGGSITPERLRSVLLRKVKSKRSGHLPSPNTIKLIFQPGLPWLRSIGALNVAPERRCRFAPELSAYTEYMRVERGLSAVTIASANEDRAEASEDVLPNRRGYSEVRNRKSEMIASECGRQSKHGRNDGAQDQRLYHCECDLGDCQHHAASGDGNKRRTKQAGAAMVGPKASIERHDKRQNVNRQGEHQPADDTEAKC